MSWRTRIRRGLNQRIVIVAVAALLPMAACRSSHASSAITPSHTAIRVAECAGPAFSLPDSLAARLPSRTGRMLPDDQWADLASSVPGGFAGVWYDGQHVPILMLTHSELAEAAKVALKGRLGFPVEQATVRSARWDFLQLVNWFNYLMPRLASGPLSGDKDEALNRIRFSVTSTEVRDHIVRTLRALNLPCDLVVVDLNGMTVRLQ